MAKLLKFLTSLSSNIRKAENNNISTSHIVRIKRYNVSKGHATY